MFVRLSILVLLACLLHLPLQILAQHDEAPEIREVEEQEVPKNDNPEDPIPSEFPGPDVKSAAESVHLIVDQFFAHQNDLHVGNVESNEDFELTESEKHARMVFCFSLIQVHIAKHADGYKEAAELAAKTRGVRSDDAIRLFFHGSLVACYHNLGDAEVHTLGEASGIADEDATKILWRNGNTPIKFSDSQEKILEKIVEKFQEASAEATPKKEGTKGKPSKGKPASQGTKVKGTWMGKLLALVTIVMMGGLFYGLARYMVQLQETGNSTRAKIKSDHKKAKVEKKKRK